MGLIYDILLIYNLVQKINPNYDFIQVEAQELKLRKVRALRGQQTGSHAAAAAAAAGGPNASVLADLESIRGRLNEKEKEFAAAVRRVEDLTRQLEDLRSGSRSVNSMTAPQVWLKNEFMNN